MIKDDKIKSITQRLSNIANQNNVPYQMVFTEFILERLLARVVSHKDLHNALVFKGGYVGLRVYELPRYTVDIDAIVYKGSSRNIVDKVKAAILHGPDDGVTFEYESALDLQTQNEYGGTRLVFRAALSPLPKNIKKAQAVNIDIGTGDPVTPEPAENKLKSLLGDQEISWLVYTPETTVAEKLHAIIVRAGNSSRAKDVFDLSVYISKCDAKVLKQALKRTFEYRKTELPNSISKRLKELDYTLLKKGWNSVIEGAEGKVDFDKCLNTVIERLEWLEL